MSETLGKYGKEEKKINSSIFVRHLNNHLQLTQWTVLSSDVESDVSPYNVVNFHRNFKILDTQKELSN